MVSGTGIGSDLGIAGLVSPGKRVLEGGPSCSKGRATIAGTLLETMYKKHFANIK